MKKNKTENLNKPEFVEISFKMPFYDIYYSDPSWHESKFEKETKELNNIALAIHITMDSNLLLDEYNKNIYEGGDCFVFHSKDKNSFIYFDLIRDKYDQMAMVFIGFKIPFNKYYELKQLIMQLYFKASVHTILTEDYFHHGITKIMVENGQSHSRKIHLIF